MLEWECPDVIVSSAKVQDMDGYELFTLVRKDPTTLDTPFLLLAGRDRPTALVAAEAGVNMVLTGDVTPDVIVARVAELLKDPRRGRSDLRSAGSSHPASAGLRSRSGRPSREVVGRRLRPLVRPACRARST